MTCALVSSVRTPIGRFRLLAEKPARKAVAARRLRFVARWRRKNGRSEPLVAASLQRGVLAGEIKRAADRLIGEAPTLDKASAACTLPTRRGRGSVLFPQAKPR